MNREKSLQTIFIKKHFCLIELFFILFTVLGVIYKDYTQAIVCGLCYFITMYILDKKEKIDNGEVL